MDRDTLAELFTEQAEWRGEKAREFPDDVRNGEAAAHLRMLAASADKCPEDLISATIELCEDAPDIEAWNEQIRQIGFHTFPPSAESVLKQFIASRTS